MIRPPSSQRIYELFYSGDPALIPLPDDATDEQKKERARLIDLARDTGQHTELLLPGEKLTLFKMRQLPAEAYGDLVAMLRNGELAFRVFALAFKVACIDAAPIPDGVKVEHEMHPLYGPIATTSFLDKAGCGGKLGANIIIELGQYVFQKAKGGSPL
jgi:hypothetical protein